MAGISGLRHFWQVSFINRSRDMISSFHAWRTWDTQRVCGHACRAACVYIRASSSRLSGITRVFQVARRCPMLRQPFQRRFRTIAAYRTARPTLRPKVATEDAISKPRQSIRLNLDRQRGSVCAILITKCTIRDRGPLRRRLSPIRNIAPPEQQGDCLRCLRSGSDCRAATF